MVHTDEHGPLETSEPTRALRCRRAPEGCGEMLPENSEQMGFRQSYTISLSTWGFGEY